MQEDDGIFWMAWDDFRNHFHSIYVCRTYEPSMRHTVKGEWKDLTAGGCCDLPKWLSNPQFLLKTEDSSPMSVFMTLTQGPHNRNVPNEQRSSDTRRGNQYYYIGFQVFKLNGRRASKDSYPWECVGASEYVDSREVAYDMELEYYMPGYTIIPTTRNENEECTFTLSVFTKHNIELIPLHM